MTAFPTYSHLITVAVSTFLCTFAGLYLHRYLSTLPENDRSQDDQTKQDKSSDINDDNSKVRGKKANQFWDSYHCDESVTTEWLADWKEIRSFVIGQLTKIMNQHKDSIQMNKSQLRILILGNGLSEIPIHLHSEGFTDITVTDVSSTAIDSMKQKYPLSRYPSIKWMIADCTKLNEHFNGNTFDVIFEKGVSDTLQYRRRTKESWDLLQSMFSGISSILEPDYGRYLCITPRRNVPLLKLAQWNWTVKRNQIRKCGPNGFAHRKQGREGSTPPFVYLHACTKINAHNHMMVMRNQQSDRRKQFEKSAENRMDFKFEPLVQIKDIRKDITNPFGHYEEKLDGDGGIDTVNENDNGCRLAGIIQEIEAYYMVHGIIRYKRKFGKRLMFYQVTLVGDEREKKEIMQCVAERKVVAELTNPSFKKEFATNYLTKCGDEVKMYGKLGLTNKGILSLFVFYVQLIQYHCNWKYE